MNEETIQQNPQSNQSETELDLLKQELQVTKEKLNELTNISQRALADLQNYKRRVEEEKAQLISFANSNLISDILPSLDNFKRAKTHLPQSEDQNVKDWATGILAIFTDLNSKLENHGLNEVDTAIAFNPNLHEAILLQDGPKDKILQVLETGYTLNTRIVRRAKVVVGNGNSTEQTNQESQTSQN